MSTSQFTTDWIERIDISNGKPDPASLALLGLGGLMMLRRKR